jgi:hypothetical protein
MWNWIERLRVWAMREFWLPTTTGVLLRSFEFHFKSGGQTVRDQAIPWNAEDLAVEVVLQTGSRRSLQAADLVLRLETGETYFPESLRSDGEPGVLRAAFRLPVPCDSVVVQLFYRSWTLGQLNLAVLTQKRFLKALECKFPSTHVRLAGRYVACQSFVAAQARGVLASAVLSSPWSLTPILDLGLRLEVYSQDGERIGEEIPGLSASLLAAREAVVVASVSVPRRKGAWRLDWLLGQEQIASQEIHAISLPQFLGQLRVSESRFLIESAGGERQLKCKLPRLMNKDRVGPCFGIVSSLAGTAGVARVQINALISKAVRAPVLAKEEHLFTDAPTLVLPGTLDTADLEGINGFEVRLGRKCLGTLPIRPAPQAQFDGEGGFQPVEGFAWDGRAEDELNERLSALTNSRGDAAGT